MFRKIFSYFLTFIFYIFSINSYVQSEASDVQSKAPDICKWIWIPGCQSGSDKEAVEWFVSNIIAELIQYVAVIAVISLMISGIMYLVSGGEEEKTNRAKRWIIWSLVWVFLSVSAWSIINIINNISIF